MIKITRVNIRIQNRITLEKKTNGQHIVVVLLTVVIADRMLVVVPDIIALVDEMVIMVLDIEVVVLEIVINSSSNGTGQRVQASAAAPPKI